MKLVFLALVMLATASALYIPVQKSHLDERGAIIDFATKIQKAIDNIKGILDSGSADKRELEELQIKTDAVLEEMNELSGRIQDVVDNFGSEEKRDLSDLSDFANKMKDKLQTMLQNIKGIFTENKLQNMITNIYGILTSGNDVDKRGLVDEAIIDEICEFFNVEAKRGLIVDSAGKVGDFVDKVKNKLKTMIMNIYSILANGVQKDRKTKRDLIDVARKIEAIFAEIKKVFKQTEKRDLVDSAQKIEDFVKNMKAKIQIMIQNIKGIIASGNDVNKRDLEDYATKIEELIQKIKNVFKHDSKIAVLIGGKLFEFATKIEAILAEIKHAFKQDAKRGLIVDGAQKVQEFAKKLRAMIVNIKNILASESQGKRGILVDGSLKIVDLAAKIEAIIDEIKNAFKQESKRGILVDGSNKLVDVAAKIEAIIDEIKKLFRSDAKRRATANWAQMCQQMINNIKDILSANKDKERDQLKVF